MSVSSTQTATSTDTSTWSISEDVPIAPREKKGALLHCTHSCAWGRQLAAAGGEDEGRYSCGTLWRKMNE